MATLDDLDVRSERDAITGCLRWTGAHTPKGYGQIVLAGRTVAVHRAAYERANGPIPEGMEVDHVYERGCRHRDCIEPSHLEAVTHAENVSRQIATVTHCPKGHEYSEENTLLKKSGRGVVGRQCRECRRAEARAAKAAKVACITCGKVLTKGALRKHERTMHDA